MTLQGISLLARADLSNRKFAIELKDDEGVQDEAQIKFQRRWERTGGRYLLVRSVMEFQGVVDGMTMFG